RRHKPCRRAYASAAPLCGSALGSRVVVRLTAGQQNGEEAPLSICKCVYLRVAPSARAASSLLLLPPYGWPAPPAELRGGDSVTGRDSSMAVAVLGIDLGKNSCSMAGLDGSGKVILRRRMQRKTIVTLAAKLSPCILAMEACCG